VKRTEREPHVLHLLLHRIQFSSIAFTWGEETRRQGASLARAHIIPHTSGCLLSKKHIPHNMEKLMNKEALLATKKQMISLMQTGHTWREAATATEASVCRSSTYRLLQQVQMKGDAAFSDGRHGHPSKLPEVVLQWLLVTCRANSQIPSREVQTSLQEQFGIHVSIGHLNRVRAQLGIGNHVGRSKKNLEPHCSLAGDERC
jgi:transposase